jgi:hypothetical protein
MTKVYTEAPASFANPPYEVDPLALIAGTTSLRPVSEATDHMLEVRGLTKLYTGIPPLRT